MTRPVVLRRDSSADVVPLGQATQAWFKVSLQTFGGPAGQISVMHREIVEERRWIGERRFLHALSYCTLLPGPEAQQLAIYLGWLLNGSAGGLIAGTLFVLPGFVTILGLSMIYAGFGNAAVVTAVFSGVAPTVLAIVAQAVRRLANRALANRFLVLLALASFVALAFFAIPFPLVIAGAAAVGFVGQRVRPGAFVSRPHQPVDGDDSPPLIPDDALHGERPSRRRAVKITVVGGLLWVAPVVAIAVVLGRNSVLVDQSKFFGGAALVTFGGAYAVLSYVAQRAVEVYGWLAPGEMVKGLALAETTPGPLIQVVQFVAFVGAFRDPGSLDPWVAATLAAVVVTWVTFVPCYLFIFLGAPHIEQLRGNRHLSAALTAVTASVVGVIANLALFFTVHTLFDSTNRRRWGPLRVDVPHWGTFDIKAATIAIVASVLIFRLRWGVLRTLGVGAVVGGLWYLALS